MARSRTCRESERKPRLRDRRPSPTSGVLDVRGQMMYCSAAALRANQQDPAPRFNLVPLCR